MKFPISKLNAIIRKINADKGIFSIWGDFGVGKTTFAIQTALNTVKFNEKVIYIYSKPNLPYEKLLSLSKGSEEVLDRIVIIKPLNFKDLNNIIFNLEFLILKKEKEIDSPYKLIIIDSLTDLYRIALNRDKKETNYNLNYQLHQMLANLSYLNELYNVEILIVNETTKVRINDHFIDKQSGGQVMDYWISTDIKIERTENVSNRHIFLTTHQENSLVKFESIITKKGFN